jgi:pantothenate kinase
MAPRIGLEDLARLLGERAAGAAPGGRVVCAVAGAPGSGKSTLAEALVDRLNDPGRGGAAGTAALLPMDGFHFDDLHLVPAGLRPRKGAPDTFDVGGLRSALLRLRARDEAFVAVPVFDRAVEIARAGARLIPAAVPVILCEGNWLLLDREPWSSLRPLFDVTVMIEVPEAELRRRLRLRWEGFGLTEDEIAWKLDGNDLPNGRLVRDGSRPADFAVPFEP